MKTQRLLLVAAFCASATFALAVPGEPDPSFGSGGGTVISSPSCGFNRVCSLQATALAYQAGGSIVLSADWNQGASASPYCSGYGYYNELVVLRRLPDGSSDAAFGSGGMARLGGIQSRSGGVLALPGGSILAAGAGFRVAAPGNCADALVVAKLNADGSLDSSFGSGGIAYGNASVMVEGPFPLQKARVDGLAVQSDGKIVVSVLDNGGRVRVLRFLANGQADASYGAAGVATLSTGATSYRGAVPLALQSDDKVVLATVARFGADATIAARLNTDGSMDSTFGSGGVANLGAAAASDRVMSIGVQGSARILVSAQGGPTASNSMPNGLVSGLVPSGAFDTSFALGGQRPTLYPRRFALQPDGRFIAAGRERMDRWTPDGWLDATFAPQGLATFDDKVIAASADKVAVADTVSSSISLWQFQAGRALDIFADNRLFVTAQYRDFFQREGEASGIAYWASQIDGGSMSRGQLIESFFGSQEFQGTASPVARLYFAYFLRIPDFAGLMFWIENYRANKDLEGISSFFERSAEFTSRYGALDNGQFVDLVYQNVLGRAPDAGGRAFWKGELDSGARTRGQVMVGFSESAEYRGLTASEVYVTMIYAGMMRRVPDAGGFAFWVDYLDRGNSGLALIDGFLSSAEYHDRYLPPP